MKKLEKLKLTQISKTELEKRQMNVLRGGYDNQCGCICVGDYVVDADVNKKYNSANGYNKPCGCICIDGYNNVDADANTTFNSVNGYPY
ncbi:MAG: TIGR04149 family rSAM-modified RiPP [Bacteroidales bacterium]|jgi:natural product precursor|nr:TIGR04149 family rSAM-modified RiPP [Bacteroidales bacterium]